MINYMQNEDKQAQSKQRSHGGVETQQRNWDESGITNQQ